MHCGSRERMPKRWIMDHVMPRLRDYAWYWEKMLAAVEAGQSLKAMNYALELKGAMAVYEGQTVTLSQPQIKNDEAAPQGFYMYFQFALPQQQTLASANTRDMRLLGE